MEDIQRLILSRGPKKSFQPIVMSKFKLLIFSALILAGMTLAWVGKRQTLNRLRDQLGPLRQQITELDSLKVENARLSNRLAQADSSQSGDQFKELLRLRGAVGGLRAQSQEVEKLRQETLQLQTARDVPPDIAGHAWLPFNLNSLAFAGYATPEATIQSALWAQSKGDTKALLDCLASAEWLTDPKIKYVVQKMQADDSGKFASAGVAHAIETLSGITGMQIVNEQPYRQDFGVSFKVLMSGQSPGLMELPMVKIGAEWKLLTLPSLK